MRTLAVIPPAGGPQTASAHALHCRPQTLQSASAALNALATLSLAGSPPPLAAPQTSTSFASAVGVIHLDAAPGQLEQAVKQEEEEQPASTTRAPSGELSGGGITVKNGKKRGTIFKCESCSKVRDLALYL